MQICDAEDVKILKGVVSKDHVHMHVEYPPSQSISDSDPADQRANVAIATTGASRVTEAILGKALLGNWIWGMEYGKFNRGVGTGVSGASSAPV